MTTAPRARPTLDESLASLAEAGWSKPRLFAEPGAVLPECRRDLPVSRREGKLGAFPNWYLGLTELFLREPLADAYLMCQDDAIFAVGSRDYLEQSLWPAAEVGVVSIYTPSHWSEGRGVPARPRGFHQVRHGWDSWGALAYVFPNRSLRGLLVHPLFVNHRHHGTAEGQRNIDSVVGAWCESAGLPYYIHVPSLVQHIGDTSTIWTRASASGPRRATDFVEQVGWAPPTNAPWRAGGVSPPVRSKLRTVGTAHSATTRGAETMADDESIRGDPSGAERRKTTKSSTEYRKTESESHEIERAGDYEKRVVSSETRETSVERSESVEIRRTAALPVPAALPAPAADWHVSMPATVRLSISGVQPESCSDAALFDGDYILDLVDGHADGCRWEVSFDAHCRLYRAALTAHCGAAVPAASYCGAAVPAASDCGVAVPASSDCGAAVPAASDCGVAVPAASGRRDACTTMPTLELRAELQGGVPGPRWPVLSRRKSLPPESDKSVEEWPSPC